MTLDSLDSLSLSKTYWLLKSEPETWSWEDQKKQLSTFWDGVRNYQACSFLKKMKIDDFAFFYHSGSQKEIVGIVRVTKTYTQDPIDPTGRFGGVDISFEREFCQPVSLAQIKADESLQHLALIRQSRLSVMPIDKASWDHICFLGKTSCS